MEYCHTWTQGQQDMSSNEISNEGAVKINHDKPIVPDVALSAMSNNVGESNVTDVTVTYETLSSQYF